MAAPPYNIILAGMFGVGKSFLFQHLSRSHTKSLRGWDKYEHVISLGSEELQVVLWDTANMEKNSILSVSKSYFTECVGVMMVYKKGDLQSLMELDKWFTRVRDITQFRSSVVFSLWCNDVGSNSDEVTPEHIEGFMTKWGVSPELHFNMSSEEEDEESVMNQYRKLVGAVRDKCNASKTTSTSLQQSTACKPTQQEKITLSTSTSSPENTKSKCLCTFL